MTNKYEISDNNIHDDDIEHRQKWRFWKWIPEEHNNCSNDDFMATTFTNTTNSHIEAVADQVKHFKEYLHQSYSQVYTTYLLKYDFWFCFFYFFNNILYRYYTFYLKFPQILDYVLPINQHESSFFDNHLCTNSISSQIRTFKKSSNVRSYFIFKEGVRPVWEDEYNVAGGCWSFRLSSSMISNNNKSQQPQDLWLLLVMFFIFHLFLFFYLFLLFVFTHLD